MDTQQTEQKPLRNLLIIGGIAIAFVAVISVVVYALMLSNDKQQQASSTSSPAPWPRVATKEEVDRNITDLNASLKQAKDDQAAANANVKDNEKQIKVGN